MKSEYPLRILQVHIFYGSYLEQFYSKSSSVSLLSSTQQINLLIQDALAAVHILPPYLENLGQESQLVIFNCPQTQQAWANEHGLTCPQWDTTTQYTILKKQIETIQPDVLYISTAVFTPAFIASLTHKPRLIMGWCAADVQLGTDWTNYDIILSGLPRLLAYAKTIGAKGGALFAPGMPSWIAKQLDSTPQDTDVVFVGGISPTQHVQRFALLDSLAQAASQHNFSLRLHLSCDPCLITDAMRPYLAPPVYGLEMHKALSRGRMVVDCRGTAGLRHPNGSYMLDFGGDELCTMRQFEATGGGSLLITENLEGIKRYFEPDTEIVTCNNISEYIEKIVYYRDHPEERQAIAQAGHQRCMQDWSMQQTAQRFMKIVYTALAQKGESIC